MKKVSIIIPIFNMEKYLSSCLDSVFKQTLKEVEVICINDGSTDNSYKILQSYNLKHENMVIINQENKGSGPARNRGLDIAKGEFIAFMDPDDYYPNDNVLETLYNSAKQNNVLICGGSLLREVEGKLINYTTELRSKTMFEKDELIQYEQYQFAFGYWRFIYSNKLLKENNILFPPYRRFQDPPFMVKAMVHAREFYAIKEPTYIARSIDKIVNFSNIEIIKGVIQAITDILKISKEYQLEDLHTSMVIELQKKYINYIYKSISLGNEDIYYSYKILQNNVDMLLVKRSKKMENMFQFLDKKEISTLIEVANRKKIELKNKINDYSRIIIYGAGTNGKLLYHYIMSLGYERNVEFAVSEKIISSTACGKEIKCISELLQELDSTLILISVEGNNKNIMKENAIKLGFKNIELIDYKNLQLFI